MYYEIKIMKKLKTCCLTEISYDLDGPLDTVITQLQDYQEKYKEYKNLRIDRDYYADTTIYNLFGDMEETDAEYAVRLELEKQHTERIKQQELEQYERLKAKFEKTRISYYHARHIKRSRLEIFL